MNGAIQHRLRGRDAAPGFTLIEIMIAVVVLGLILLMLTQSFHAVATSKVHGENVLAVAQAARNITLAMSDELRGAVQTPFTASKTMLAGHARMQHFVPMDTLSVSTLDPGHRRSDRRFRSGGDCRILQRSESQS